MRNSELLTVFGEAEVGDFVDVQMPEGHVFQAALLAYAVPLLFLIIGLIVGDTLGLTDIWSLLLAAAGLALGFVLARMADKYLRTLKKWRPAVLKAYKPDEAAERERNTEK